MQIIKEFWLGSNDMIWRFYYYFLFLLLLITIFKFDYKNVPQITEQSSLKASKPNKSKTNAEILQNRVRRVRGR